jgi:hypothetical protein
MINKNNILRIYVRWFDSVAVLTSAIWAEGPQIDPGRNHFLNQANDVQVQ